MLAYIKIMFLILFFHNLKLQIIKSKRPAEADLAAGVTALKVGEESAEEVGECRKVSVHTDASNIKMDIQILN